MRIKWLILNLHLRDIERGGHIDLAHCNAYPGARWIHYVSNQCRDAGVSILPSAEAMSLLKTNQINPDECALLTEHEDLTTWSNLASLGVKNTIAFCFESPMYAWQYYDLVLKNELPSHKVRLGFPNGGNLKEPIFPSYDKQDIVRNAPHQIDKTVAVMSNKCWVGMPMADKLIAHSPSFKMAIANELHTRRFGFLRSLAYEDFLDVYGYGWEHGNDILMLKPFIKNPIQQVQDKAKLLQQYKTCFVMENVNYEGYVTEKPIEAIVNGCYLAGTIGQQHLLLRFIGLYGLRTDAQDKLEETHATNPFSHTFMATRVMQELDRF